MAYLFIIHVVLIMPVIIAGSQITRTAMQSRSIEQIRSVGRTLYGATRGLVVPKWLVQGSALPRVPPFFSLAIPPLPILFFRIRDFHVSRIYHDKHHCRKIAFSLYLNLPTSTNWLEIQNRIPSTLFTPILRYSLFYLFFLHISFLSL